MKQGIPPEVIAALKSRAVRARDMVSFTVRDSDTGDPVTRHYWSDVGQASLNVINPTSQLVETRVFKGAGGLISVSDIPQVSNLTVQPVMIEISHLADTAQLVRELDAKQGRVEIFRGVFAVDSLLQIAPARARFIGFIDEADVEESTETEPGKITLNCVSHLQEITRFNPATRSNAYQQRRAPGDDFRKHVAVVGTWEQRWGEA
ncbi:hypothetical protein [Roseovarius sp. MMSF_3350]|uniref:hypothetical protein n=1 Tax=Roseovarius sp. MMSF_3350 TaxID=3046706 RepID=UPI00273D53BF|nr:hypothetical protein [Roseovarius sp. MMSF_3350]